MSEVCPKCGLVKELCVCETIAKGGQKIKIRVVKRKFGKMTTLVEGIDEKDIEIKDLAKKLKSKIACGGTSKRGVIELQGSHAHRTKDELIKIGFAPETISIEG